MGKEYTTVLFDLDGTLTDPGVGITNSVMYALNKFNIEVTDRTSLYKFIGPPLLESFQKYYGLTKEESEQALQYYREYFRPYGLYENEVYPGIEEMLMGLREKGKRLILATSKPEEFAVEILKHFQLYAYFAEVGGASMDEKRTDKADVISYVLEKAHVEDRSKVVMVGDRKHDIIGAKKNGLDSIGVLYGYGDYEELEKAGATYIVEKPEDLLNLV